MNTTSKDDKPGLEVDTEAAEESPTITTQPQQPQQAAVVYPVSDKLEIDSKGFVKPSVHLYGYDPDKTVSQSVRLFFEVKSQIVECGGKVLET